MKTEKGKLDLNNVYGNSDTLPMCWSCLLCPPPAAQYINVVFWAL